ncbi:site-specific recombinase XerD [Pseudomonas sp. GGS8]|jgi:site-specific recombinase XerD|uniref:integrase n=1 Tax=unclassified Pseudomonas TaxID=196821 RepID=UPI00209FE0B4|nr:integrase [Pseudomonas sp. GGS8]MCP1443153.1 site-specific recombinase XerD [Pseudomonas sp. GGS8]
MAKVAAFLSRLELDRVANLSLLVEKAQMLGMLGFESIVWDEPKWKFTAGPMTILSAKRSGSPSIYFRHAPNIGEQPMEGDWAAVAKSLFCLRAHRSNQKISNQQMFVTAISYISHCVGGTSRPLSRLMPEDLDSACRLISGDYQESTAYNLHKAINEFAAHCDANQLCNVRFEYKYSGLKRPANAGGVAQKRLDAPENLEQTSGDRLINLEVFELIGLLYQHVPSNHKYRMYILMLVLLACIGRRFSEIATLPLQEVGSDSEGRKYLRFFLMKTSKGDNSHPIDRTWLPTDAVSIVEDVIAELTDITRAARSTAQEMRITGGPDLRWIAPFAEDHRFYIADLDALGFTFNVLRPAGWLTKNGLTFPDPDKLTVQGIRPAKPSRFTTKQALMSYCKSMFDPRLNDPVRIAASGQVYYQEDLFFVRYAGMSSGGVSVCVVAPVTHSMFTTFIRDHLEPLASEYGGSNVKPDFSSHDFRHTINTLLNDGGMSDYVQTKWFGRKYANDTKAYQHTSREKRALIYQEKIREGKIGGAVADNYIQLPVEYKEAYLKAKITGVHELGTGMCTRNLSQSPCPNHLECHAKCSDFSWEKDDDGKKAGVVRAFEIEVVQYENAITKSQSNRPGESHQWLAHSQKKIETLTAMLVDLQMDAEAIKAKALGAQP